MDYKKQLNAFLLGFAIGTLVFATSMAYVIGKINRDYNKKIRTLEILKNK
jgi:hypothetical protein